MQSPVALSVPTGATAVDLKDDQEQLLVHAQNLESRTLDLNTELACEKASLELRIAERLTHLLSANAELERQVAELSRRNREITLFSRMNDFLHACGNEAEAYAIIAETVPQLLPGCSGAVFVINASRDMLEAAVVWGPQAPAKLVFPPQECWAQRRGQVHAGNGQGQRCLHVNGDGRRYACLPLLAQGETLGLLHLLDGPVVQDAADEAQVGETYRLARTLADYIGQGINDLKLRDTLRNLSIRDPLTGLFNRRYMEETLARERHRTVRGYTQLAVIMIDIDNFKQFNDTYGHDGGDAVLRALGAFFRKSVRASDVACRHGGEEFIVVLSPASVKGARKRAEKIRSGARLLQVNHGGRDLGGITLSMGVAIFPDHALDATAIIKAADMALYQAKGRGRDQVVVFEGPQDMKGISGASA